MASVSVRSQFRGCRAPMLTRRRSAGASVLLGVVCWLVASPAPAQNATLGTINFPNSGAPAAQPFFIEGVKFLHSFEWEDAADRFRKAQQADPGFALAYWGEALSYTGGHHYPMQQDISSARKALVKLAATRADRLAKAPTERERGYLNAVEVLYGEGDGQERAQRYASAMGMLSERFPDDDEAATLHALALMRTARRGRESTRVDLQAGAICLRVFRRNGSHPGAVHYIVHAFDEPTRAIVGLEAADVYAYLAPDAPHALHMPSHIYVQLGQWDKLSAANERSYAASARRSEQKQLRGIEQQAFHAMFWLHYAYSMKARKAAETKQVEIMALEADGMARLARGDRNTAVKKFEQAAEVEESMDPPSGPPGEQDDDPPIKPAHELLGEVLLELGRPADAAKQFAIGLDRMPNRPRLLLGAARAAVKVSDQATAQLRYRQLLNLPGGGPDRPGLDEAKAFAVSPSTPAGR